MIPPFDHNEVLPPHLGDPTQPGDLSPYKSDILELCQRFATTKQRKEILLGLVNFRIEMVNQGITTGFQWIDGSFVENIEVLEKRAPGDIDVVTFFGNIPTPAMHALIAKFPEFADFNLSKAKYNVDHYPVDFTYHPLVTVEATSYWVQLFTHSRGGVWKGIVELPLNTIAEDQAALNFLNLLAI